MKKVLVDENQFEKVMIYSKFLKKLDGLGLSKSKHYIDKQLETALSPNGTSIGNLAEHRAYLNLRHDNLSGTFVSMEHLTQLIRENDDMDIKSFSKKLSTYNKMGRFFNEEVLEFLFKKIGNEFVYFEIENDPRSRLMAFSL